MPVSTRPAVPADEQLLDRIVYDVLFEQLCAATWPPEIREQLLNLQVRAKRGSYASGYPNAGRSIIQRDNDPVGQMVVDRTGDYVHLIDISILPRHCGKGIGTLVIESLCAEAGVRQKAVRLFVSTTNSRARKLYERLGFRVIQELETDSLMERLPSE